MASSTVPAAKTQAIKSFVTRGFAAATPLAIDYAPIGAEKIQSRTLYMNMDLYQAIL